MVRKPPTNPTLKLADIAAISAIAKARSIRVVVDNTFASPVLQQPLALGADVVLHSTTKYINGHSDVVGGALITSDAELCERIPFLQNAIGAVPSPMDCYLVMRGIKTLPLRMRAHVAGASELATRWPPSAAYGASTIPASLRIPNTNSQSDKCPDPAA